MACLLSNRGATPERARTPRPPVRPVTPRRLPGRARCHSGTTQSSLRMLWLRTVGATRVALTGLLSVSVTRLSLSLLLSLDTFTATVPEVWPAGMEIEVVALAVVQGTVPA